ncbi:MAG TPA: DUF3888 domain-containing protein [Clostridia bacterium]|nr:DUF3888 domain-containing protein [Clostridia bacterium]
MKKVIVMYWKKTAVISVLATLLVGLVLIYRFTCERPLNTYQKIASEPFQTYFEPAKPPEGSVEEIYLDVLMSLLMPYIDKAVENYYGQGYAVAPYSVKVLNIDRPNGYRTFGFVMKLEVMPYTLAHITIGVDHITIRVDTRNVTVEKFEHIKSYEIPKHR